MSVVIYLFYVWDRNGIVEYFLVIIGKGERIEVVVVCGRRVIILLGKVI